MTTSNSTNFSISRDDIIKEALRLIGSAQTAVWIAPYQP